MALTMIPVNKVISRVADATRENPANFYHTWDGWVSKDILHIKSRSGVRTRDVWHFPLGRDRGRRLFFKNTTAEAYCYVRDSARNELEEILYSLNTHCRVEYVDTIDVELYEWGSGCGHNTGNRPFWYTVLTDGSVQVVREPERIKHHGNQYHIGCPTGVRTVKVTSGTYGIQVDVGQNRFSTCPEKAMIRKDADFSFIAKVVKADAATRLLKHRSGWMDTDYVHPDPEERETRQKDRETIVRLAQEIAGGYPYPAYIRKRMWGLTGRYDNPFSFVNPELRVSLAPAEEREKRLMAEKAVRHVKETYDVYTTRPDDWREYILVHRDQKPNWKKIQVALYPSHQIDAEGWVKVDTPKTRARVEESVRRAALRAWGDLKTKWPTWPTREWVAMVVTWRDQQADPFLDYGRTSFAGLLKEIA